MLMHEAGVAQAIVKIASKTASKAGAKVVKSVKVEIGDLQAVNDDSLRFFFEAITKRTMLEGAELQIKHIPIRAYCSGCHRKVKIERTIFACPLCGSFEVSPRSGQELFVRSIEVEDETEGDAGNP